MNTQNIPSVCDDPEPMPDHDVRRYRRLADKLRTDNAERVSRREREERIAEILAHHVRVAAL